MNPDRILAKRLPMIPGRQSPHGSSLRSQTHMEAGDLFWKSAVECFKPVYTRIDQRFAGDRDKHQRLLHEAKKILQEHRNLIVENVLPMFAVTKRHDQEPSEADAHVADYFCRNVWVQMVDTLIASLDLFVERDDVEPVASAVRKIAEVQRARMEAQLLNFVFTFRPVKTPQQVRKGK